MVTDSPHGNYCGAKTNAGGECKRRAMPNGRCMVHGGKSLSGLAHPSTRTGRYSKHLPTRLAERFHESVTDPDLLSQREDIALLDSRLTDVMDSASNMESGELWKNLKDALKQYDKASGKDADAQRAEAFSQIRWLIREGYQEWQSWKDIRFILQERKNLVESERKRLVDMQQMITAAQANLLLGAVAHIIKTHVSDRTTLAAIASELGKLVAAGTSEVSRSAA